MKYLLLLFCLPAFAQSTLRSVDNLTELVKIKPSSKQPLMLVIQPGIGAYRVFKWSSTNAMSTSSVAPYEIIAYPYGSSTGRWVYVPGCGCSAAYGNRTMLNSI